MNAAGPSDGDWRTLWQEYGAKLLLFARQQAPTPNDAEDIVQEAFVRYWKACRHNPELTPRLLFTFVKRAAIDQARQRAARRAREAEVMAANGPPEQWFEDPAEERERKEYLESALKGLPEDQREVLVLKIWSGLTFEEIGQILEISPHTVASRYRYGVDRLRRLVMPALL